MGGGPRRSIFFGIGANKRLPQGSKNAEQGATGDVEAIGPAGTRARRARRGVGVSGMSLFGHGRLPKFLKVERDRRVAV